MSSSSRRGVSALLLAALACALAPARAEAHSRPVDSRPVLVFAAASLQTALGAVAAEWRRETGKAASFSFAGSPSLARQIEQGAPADLFVSADVEWMDWAEARKLVRPGSRRNLLGNALVLIAPLAEASDLRIAPAFPLVEALGGSRLATGNPASVPLGRYAEAALRSLGVWSGVGPLIAGADNARAALALVARGEARFGVVYETDARAEPRVRIVGVFPPESHPPILYPFALTARSTNPDAEAFLGYMGSPAAIRIFEAQGFRIVR
jgi:molybdate transport system substrate-binding protein